MKNLIYADNIDLIGDMGQMVQICNLLNYVTFIFGFIFCLYFRNKRLGITIAAVCAWEYFMYTGFIFRTPAFMAVLFIVLHFTNYDALQYKYSIKNS